LIEDQGSGTPLIQDLRHEGVGEVQGCKSPRDKRTRLMAQTPAFEAERVHLPIKASWLPTL
jgi:predicted phage terminase large subunit-like protein